ncbi:unnamed protein product [Durusdinium trenchii]|uniref:PDZ domain-containing protein n=1 Tax=Durusdinium trenchii TaxID=1381693 RepID=A0ABP0ST77_9DINO
MRAYQPSVEPLLEVLQTLKARFQAQEHLPELQGQQLSEELSVTVALLLSDGQLGLELTDPTNESEKKSPIEVLALEALLAQKLWQESKDSKVSRLLEVGALRFRLGDFAIALHDLTLVVEQEPANKEAVRLLERCEKEVAREVQEKAGYLYSLEWSDGEDASVVEALESERLRELQELSTTEAPNTPHAQRLRAVHLDRLGARRLGLRLRELVNGLEVEEIRDGVVKDWNATASPGERIGVGDKIVKVNQVRGSGRMLLAEFRKDQVLHLLVAPPGDDIVASEASNKVPPRAEELTWQDLSLQQLLGWSPPGLCDWQWHETPLQQATGLGPWKMAVVQLDGCTWTSEVDEVFMTSLECQERISFPSKSCLAKLQSLDLILVPLLLDEEVEELSELCEEVRRFLAELQEMDPFARIVALTCGSNGPDCFGARDDGFGMPAAAPARGMFRCFRLEHPETPILHIDTDAVGPGKTAELEAQIRRELTWRYNTQQASDLAFLGREVAYRRQRRFVPQLDVCRQAPARKRACLQRTGVALITGGTGGLGLTTAEVLVDAGVRHVVLCSRSGKVSADAPGQLMERLEGLQRTATVVLEACDAADEDQVLAMWLALNVLRGG